MWGAIASIGASLLGSMIQGDAAGDAADTQAQATGAAINEQKRQFDLNRADLAPYRSAGGQAVNRLQTLLGLGPRPKAGAYDAQALLEKLRPYYKGSTPLNDFAAGLTGADQNEQLMAKLGPELIGPAQDRGFVSDILPKTAADEADYGALNRKFTLADFWDDPVTKASFQFGLDEGTKALDRMAGARGMRNSGQQLKALTKFGTDYTGGQVAGSSGRFYQDQDRTFNRLSGVAGTGQTAATSGASLGTGQSNTISGLISGQGNAAGAAGMAGANAAAGALNNVSNYFTQQSALDRILKARGYRLPTSGWGEADM